MAITAAKRKRLPRSSFALPSKRKYPIDTKKRAKAALSYAARSTTEGSYATVRKKVLARYPSLKKTGRATRTSSRRR